ncbi:hypothetical protein BHE74_00019827 [Ensete ventricosum]|nr:hypothetical protein BHE74_00019827 [Ensete ventricosum]
MGSRWKFARRFAEGIGKLAGNVKGDYRKIFGGCRIMRKIRAAASNFRWVNRPNRPYHRRLHLDVASVEQCQHGTSQRIDSYSSVDFGDRGVELFPSSRGNEHAGTHLKLQLEIVQRSEIFPSTVNLGLPVVIAEAFLSFTHQVQALAGMMQVIIPHIPQLMQSTTPQQSAPSECSPNRPRLERISPT